MIYEEHFEREAHYLSMEMAKGGAVSIFAANIKDTADEKVVVQYVRSNFGTTYSKESSANYTHSENITMIYLGPSN